VGEGEANEAMGDHHGFHLCVRLSEPVHSDPLTVSTRLILQPPQNRVESPRLASIGGQSKKLKISTFGWGW